MCERCAELSDALTVARAELDRWRTGALRDSPFRPDGPYGADPIDTATPTQKEHT